MTSRSTPGGRAQVASIMHRLYLAACWSLLIATAAAAGVCIVVMTGQVLQAI